MGTNLLVNGDFSRGMEGWKIDRAQNTVAEDKIEDLEGGKHAIHITVPKPAEKRFFVQLTEKGSFPIVDGKKYTLSFRARAKPAAQIVVVFSPAQGAWEALGRQDNIKLTEEWVDYSFTIAPPHGTPAARMSISGLSGQAAEYWFTDVSMKENQ